MLWMPLKQLLAIISSENSNNIILEVKFGLSSNCSKAMLVQYDQIQLCYYVFTEGKEVSCWVELDEITILKEQNSHENVTQGTVKRKTL